MTRATLRGCSPISRDKSARHTRAAFGRAHHAQIHASRDIRKFTRQMTSRGNIRRSTSAVSTYASQFARAYGPYRTKWHPYAYHGTRQHGPAPYATFRQIQHTRYATAYAQIRHGTYATRRVTPAHDQHRWSRTARITRRSRRGRAIRIRGQYARAFRIYRIRDGRDMRYGRNAVAVGRSMDARRRETDARGSRDTRAARARYARARARTRTRGIRNGTRGRGRDHGRTDARARAAGGRAARARARATDGHGRSARHARGWQMQNAPRARDAPARGTRKRNPARAHGKRECDGARDGRARARDADARAGAAQLSSYGARGRGRATARASRASRAHHANSRANTARNSRANQLSTFSKFRANIPSCFVYAYQIYSTFSYANSPHTRIPQIARIPNISTAHTNTASHQYTRYRISSRQHAHI